jgi:hypothetical protein
VWGVLWRKYASHIETPSDDAEDDAEDEGVKTGALVVTYVLTYLNGAVFYGLLTFWPSQFAALYDNKLIDRLLQSVISGVALLLGVQISLLLTHKARPYMTLSCSLLGTSSGFAVLMALSGAIFAFISPNSSRTVVGMLSGFHLIGLGGFWLPCIIGAGMLAGKTHM